MSNIIKIAVDAMGGDGSPKKIIDGIIHHYKKNNNTFYKIFGDQEKISKFISSSLNKDAFEIIHTNGRPTFKNYHISISHSAGVCVAVCIYT